MNRQLKVYMIPYGLLAAALRGQAPILNMPADAEIISHHNLESIRNTTGVAVLVHSLQFDEVPLGMRLPVVTAVFAKRKDASCA